MKTVYQTVYSKYFLLFILFSSFVSYAQTTVPFVKRFERTGINGDLTIIGNSTLGKFKDQPYNGLDVNNNIDMIFIDVDNDPSTFSSSSANFNTNACNKVVYAGLYWGSKLFPSGDAPSKVKFKVPGGAYQLITADLIDSSKREKLDRVYYKDVTSIVSSIDNPSGDYFVADLITNEERNNSAGWALVIVYEDPTESRKYISTFDGFTRVNGRNPKVDFSYTGFKTPPTGPVEGRIGVAAIEGDLKWDDDQMHFRSNLNDTGGLDDNFTALYDDESLASNFFNSKITIDGAYVTNRNVNSTNTLGWDLKLLDLTPLNVGNSLIGNNETGATVRVLTGGDQIFTFLNTFAINIIEPVLQVVTSVEDTNGNTITHNSPVPLGATVWYNINFQNVGTDNAQNTYVINTLPINVTLDESSIVIPAGVTYSYNNTTRELRFDIDNSLVEKKSLSSAHDIRYQVTASDNCFDYTDACTNLLENSIMSYYDGETSGENISGHPGYNGINGCGLGSVGSMDLFVDTSSCSFDSELFFCNNTLTFEGDNGYDTYIWTDEAGNVISNTKEVTVTGAGIYVATQTRTGCTKTIRTVTVNGLDVTITPSDVLCKDAINGQVEITINETSTAFSYELYKGSSLIDSKKNITSNTHTFTNLDIGNYMVKSINADGCFDESTFSIAQPTLLEASSVKLFNVTTCNGAILNGSVQASASGGIPPYEFSIDGGTTYQTEDTFLVATEKTYEILVKDANGCVTPTNIAVGFDPEIIYEITKEDVICVGDSDGRISVNLTNDQGYKISYSMDGENYQNSQNFSGLAKGSYELWVKKDNGFNMCETMNTVEIDQLVYLQLTAETDFTCEGASNIVIAQVDPIYQNDVTFYLDGANGNSTGIFENVSKGSHMVTVKHNDYGCSDTPVEVVVQEYIPISFKVDNTYINEYTINATGGEPGYEYSINSVDDFGSDNVFQIRKTGDYTFYVKDQRGCMEEVTMFLEFLDIEIPDFFTPQGDGYNDTWYPINIEPYPNITVKIFDRYQRLIGNYKGLGHSWDGNYKGKPLPSGDYWYFISLNEGMDNREYKGNFSLVR